MNNSSIFQNTVNQRSPTIPTPTQMTCKYSFPTQTYVYYGNQDLLTLDNGFRGVVEGIAGEYLQPNDPRIILNAPVGNIEYNANTGVTVTIAGTSLQFHANMH